MLPLHEKEEEEEEAGAIKLVILFNMSTGNRLQSNWGRGGGRESRVDGAWQLH